MRRWGLGGVVLVLAGMWARYLPEVEAAPAAPATATSAAARGPPPTPTVPPHCTDRAIPAYRLTPEQVPGQLGKSATLVAGNGSRVGPGEWEGWASGWLALGPEGLLSAALLLWDEAHVRLAYRQAPAPNHSAPAYLRAMTQANITHPTWSAPFWDCVLAKWIFGYISPSLEDRGLMGLYYPLERVDLDQCDENLTPYFTGSPKCDSLTTKCEPVSGDSKFRNSKRSFDCVCLPGFVPPPLDLYLADRDHDVQSSETIIYRCVPSCGNGTFCSAQPHFLLKTAVISVQIFCMVFTIAVGFVIFKRRKCKPVAAGMWTILEILLLGIFLLYGSVVFQSFEPSIERCIIDRWIRELGFIICYGAIILKLYRILMEFRTRKAHRWVIRDKDLLKYLLGMVLIMFCYLSAWTATNLNFIKEGFSIVATGQTNTGEYFQACKPLWWDYITQAGEIVILLFGLHLGVAARNATVQYMELRYLVCAIVIETVNSSLYYLVQAALWKSLHPDHSYLASFLRCHLTSTLVLLLVFLPTVPTKLILFNQKPVRDSRHHLTHEPSDAYKPQDGLYSDIDVAEVNLSDMNPEEIRAELKRLYTQLEILKNKTIRQNNPHISKRRGGRKVAHRRFSLQKKGSREKALQQKQRCSMKPGAGGSGGGSGSGGGGGGGGSGGGDQGESALDQELSRTPEDSVCSIEGPSAIYNDGPSTYSELCAAAASSAHHTPKQ